MDLMLQRLIRFGKRRRAHLPLALLCVFFLYAVSAIGDCAERLGKVLRSKPARQLAAAALSLCLVFNLVPMTAFAAESDAPPVGTEQEKTLTYAEVVALFAALPNADSITAETTEEEKAEITAQINAALDALDGLSDKDFAKFADEHSDLLAAVQALQTAIINDTPTLLAGTIAVELWRDNAKVDPNGDFATLAAAITAAQDGDTLKIIDNIDLGTTGVEISGKSLTLDLNGYTITYGGLANGRAIKLEDGAGLTIKDSGAYGKLATTGMASAIYNNSSGTVTVEGGTVSAVSGYAIFSYSSGNVMVTGGTVSASGGGSCAIHSSSGTVTVSGGTVSATGQDGMAIKNASAGKITISGNAVVTSENKYNMQGTIYLNIAPSPAAVVLEIKDSAQVTNTANPAGYSVYFAANGVTADNLSSYFSHTGGTVGRVHPAPAAVPTVVSTSIYANGAPLILAAGASDIGKTVIYVDEDGSGSVSDGDSIFKPGDFADGTITGNNLVGYTIYGGSDNTAITGETKITMLGGNVSTVYGGSKNAAVSSTNVTISGGTAGSVYGGGDESTTGTATVTGTAAVKISGGETSYVYGGAYKGTVNNASVNITGGKVNNVCGGGSGSGSSVNTAAITISGGTVTNNVYGGAAGGTVGRSSLSIGSGAKIGGSWVGVIINSADATTSGAVKNGVDSFKIDPDLGTDGSVYVFLPYGYTGGAIATEAVEADLAKITLTGDGASGKEAYFEDSTIKVRATTAAVELWRSGARQSEHATLAAAITAAQTGDTLKIMNNIDLGTTGVAIKSKSLTLNLNGKTITYGGGSDAIELDSNAGLTVTDGGSGGKLEATAHLGRAIHNYDSGTVVVEGGTVSATGPSGFAIDNYAGTVKVTGGTVSATGEAGFAINNFLSGTVVVEGGTVSATGESGTAIYNKIRGTVTVKGGTVSAAGSLGVAIRNDSTGEIKVESGTVSADNGSYVIQNNSTGTVTVKGGTVSAENGDGIAIMNNNEGKITVEGGAVSIVNGNGTAIANESTGTVTVEGGKVCAVNGNGNAIANRSNGKVVVSGGTVSATGHSGKAIWNDLNGKIIISGTAVVTSRNTAANQGTIYFNGVPTPAAVVLEISGGEVENTAADGYAVYFTPSRVTSANLSSYYSHTGGTVGRVRPAPTPAIAVELWRGDSKVSPDGDFDTLAAAIDAAQDGDTLKIMADINLGTTGVDIKGKTLILDLNGQTITYSGDQNAISLVNTASLTVTDGGTGGKLEATGNGGYAIMNGTSGTISVTGGTVSASGSSGVAIADLSRGNIKISGNAAITSKNASATEGTIFITGIPLSADVALEITGSKVENTVTDGYAVYFSDSKVTSNNLSSYYKHTGGTVGRVHPEPLKGVELLRGGTAQGKYDTLSGAITAAQSGDTLKILGYIDLGTTGVEISGKSLTLDLNGKTVTYSGVYSAIVLQDGADLTVTDGGSGGRLKATDSADSAIANDSTGTVTVSGGTVTASSSYGSIIAIANDSTGKVTVTGGTVSATGAYGIAIRNLSTGKVTVTGGTVEATDAAGIAIRNLSTGKITISGSAVVTSENTFATEGTIYFREVPTPAAVVLEIIGGTVKNTASPADNSVYFYPDSVTVDNLSSYYSHTGGTVGRVHPAPPSAAPTVSSVTVSPNPAAVQKGMTQQFTAIVSGTNNPAQTVSWTVTGGKTGTDISNTGLLTVAADETAATLTVTAISAVDTTKSGSAAVTVQSDALTDAQKLAMAKSAIAAALDHLTVTNAATAQDILDAANVATLYGVAVAWDGTDGFSKTEATTGAAGSITGTLRLTLNGENGTVTVSKIIAILPDKTALTTAIAAANSAKNSVVVRDLSPSSVASGTRFVTTVEMETLNIAIAAAQTVMDNSAAAAAEITAAVSALNRAVTAFNGAIKTGTYTGGSSSGSGGSSGGGSGGGTVTPPTEAKPSAPTESEIKVDGKVDANGSVTVTLPEKTVDEAIKKAEDEARKNGNLDNGVTLVLNVRGGGSAGSVTVNLPKTTQETIISKKIVNTVIVVNNPDIKIGMDLSAVTSINTQAKADVNITATKQDNSKLTGNAKTAIGARPVFDLRVNYGGGKQVADFDGGSVSVAIPYTLGAGEKAGGVYAVYVDGSGNVQWLTSSVYDAENKVLRFNTNHFSTYGVGYQAPADFTDIAGHWAEEDIQFVVNRGLLSGTGAAAFSPNTAMTRGMFVTALGRLAGADVSGYKQSSFTDVKADAYYMSYVEWAAKNGIVKGTTSATFAPDNAVTREQMAVMVANYAKAIGFELPKAHAQNTFVDAATISPWAADSVKAMQMAGVLAGKNINRFDPQGTAARAEAAATLRHFMELMIDASAAQGWIRSDNGQWMYYENGSPVKNTTRNVGGENYSFNTYGVTLDFPKRKTGFGTYTVQAGDSFWLIAEKHNVSMHTLAEVNGKTIYSVIHPGDALKIPQ